MSLDFFSARQFCYQFFVKTILREFINVIFKWRHLFFNTFIKSGVTLLIENGKNLSCNYCQICCSIFTSCLVKALKRKFILSCRRKKNRGNLYLQDQWNKMCYEFFVSVCFIFYFKLTLWLWLRFSYWRAQVRFHMPPKPHLVHACTCS